MDRQCSLFYYCLKKLVLLNGAQLMWSCMPAEYLHKLNVAKMILGQGLYCTELARISTIHMYDVQLE